MATFDQSLESYINQSMSNKQQSPDVKLSASIYSRKTNDIAEKARLFDEAVEQGFGAVSVRDGSFNNPEMRTGASNYMLNSGYFMNDMITFRRNELTAIYHGCWIFRKIVDIPARDMWSRGITINNDNDSQDLKEVYGLYNRVKSDMIYATQQSRIYGGAAAFIMVDDGEEDLSKPLKLKNIKKGSPIKFIITDRWYGLDWSSEVVDNYASPEFGLPKYYSFFVEGSEELAGEKIHHSRVLRFVNRRSPRIIEQQLQGWGVSELEHVLQDLMNHENTKNSIASLLNKSLLEIVKLEGMRNTMSGLSSGNPQASQMFAAQMTALNNYRTSNNLVFMDKQDEYQKEEYGFSGLSDILNSQKDIVAGAAEMPEVMLFGTNRAGLNGDSPIELRLYANTILGRQDQEVRPVLDKLLPILYRICGFEVPRNLSYEFEGLLDVSNESKQSMLQSIVSNVTQLLDAGLITRETALAEIQSAQKQTGFGTKIEQRDIDLAKEEDKQAAENPEGSELGLDGEEGGFGEFGNETENITENKVENVSDTLDDSGDYSEIKNKIIQATLRDKKKWLR